MSEEPTAATTQEPVAPTKRKGRPVTGSVRSRNLRKQERATKTPSTPATKTAKEFVPQTEPDHNGRMVTHPRQGVWNLAKAREVMLYEDESKPLIEQFTLGTLPTIEIMRGRKVIIPHDIFTVLQDKMHPTIACDNSDPNKPRLYEKMVTTMPFQDFGERTWDEYLDFLAAESKKKKFNGSD